MLVGFGFPWAPRVLFQPVEGTESRAEVAD